MGTPACYHTYGIGHYLHFLPLKTKERKTLTMKETKPSEIKDDDLKAHSFFFFSNSIPVLIFKPHDSVPFC